MGEGGLQALYKVQGGCIVRYRVASHRIALALRASQCVCFEVLSLM